MTPLNRLAVAAAAMCLSSTTVASALTIDEYRWHDRLLIVFAGNADAPEWARQRATIADAGNDFSDRDLRTIEIVGNTVTGSTDTPRALRRRFTIGEKEFRVLLIGKDGGVKIDSTQPVTSRQLMLTIDAMPMRREEMRGRAP